MTESAHAAEEGVDLLLESANLLGHLLELLRVLDAVGTAVGRIETLEVEVAASLTWGFAIAFDLAPLALVAFFGLVVHQHTLLAHY